MLNLTINQNRAYIKNGRSLTSVSLDVKQALSTINQTQTKSENDCLKAEIVELFEKEAYINPGGDNVKSGMLISHRNESTGSSFSLYLTKEMVMPLFIPGFLINDDELSSLTYADKLKRPEYANVILPPMLVLKTSNDVMFGFVQDPDHPDIELTSHVLKPNTPFSNMWERRLIVGAQNAPEAEHDKISGMQHYDSDHASRLIELFMAKSSRDERFQRLDSLYDFSAMGMGNAQKALNIVEVIDTLLERHFPELSKKIAILHSSCFESNAKHHMSSNFLAGFVSGMTAVRNDDLSAQNFNPITTSSTVEMAESLHSYLSKGNSLCWASGDRIQITSPEGDTRTLPRRNSYILYALIKAHYDLDSENLVIAHTLAQHNVDSLGQDHKGMRSVQSLLLHAPRSVANLEFRYRNLSINHPNEGSDGTSQAIINMLNSTSGGEYGHGNIDIDDLEGSYTLTLNYRGVGEIFDTRSDLVFAMTTLLFETTSMLDTTFNAAILQNACYSL